VSSSGEHNVSGASSCSSRRERRLKKVLLIGLLQLLLLCTPQATLPSTLRGTWRGCGQQLAAAREDGRSSAQLHVLRLTRYSNCWRTNVREGVDEVVVAAGAGVGTLGEVFQGLPQDLCQGYTLDLELGSRGLEV
jgi:hypothetical protein